MLPENSRRTTLRRRLEAPELHMSRLRLFRSLWGIDRQHRFPSWPMLLGELQRLGYAGIEASLPDLGGSVQEREQAAQAVHGAGMKLIIGVYSSWQDYEDVHDHYKAPDQHLKQLEEQLKEAGDLGAEHINAHSGCDAWGDEACVDFFGRLMDLQARSRSLGGPTVSHETHRGRPLGQPFLAQRLMGAIPDLRITADISHWIVVAERVLGRTEAERSLLRLAAERTDHIHARIGTPQAPQFSEADAAVPEHESVEAHFHFWRMVRKAREARGTTATPEYGPYPYHTGTSDPWEVVEMASRQLVQGLAQERRQD